jgi:hypothetical protein
VPGAVLGTYFLKKFNRYPSKNERSLTQEEVKSLKEHARSQLLPSSAGYWRMRQILMQEYETHVGKSA